LSPFVAASQGLPGKKAEPVDASAATTTFVKVALGLTFGRLRKNTWKYAS